MEHFRSIIRKLELKDSIKAAYDAVGNNEAIIFFREFKAVERRHLLNLDSNDSYDRQINSLTDRWLNQIDYSFTEEEINAIALHLHLGVSQKDLLKKLNSASVLLTTWPHTFQNTNGYHIPRKETNSLLQWIEASLPDEAKGLALLVGDAGSGKSVILRDIFHDLDERQIPVLGIKADRYCTESIADLEKRLNLSEGIESMIRALARSNDRVVVMVDQIDALSQSLSTRRAYLDTFIHLISLLTDIPNIRIVISCRTYDLENDQALSFYGQQKKFLVGKLEEAEVKMVIQQLSDKTVDLSSSLLELLKTPLHLDVFCRIYHPNFSTEKLTILRDLYDELWRQKITEVLLNTDNHISAQQCKMVMYKLAEDMYIQQSLEVPVKSKYAEFAPELKYLRSTGLLYKNQNGLAFFHQTFYDYTFALQFVDSKISIEDYLNKSEQSLHIRACLKMMIEFLRDRDQVEYVRLYRSILNSPDYYFHIKSLLISLLAAIKQPTRAEIQLAEEIIFPNPGFFKFFIQTLNSSEWLLLLLEQGLLEGLYLPEPSSTSGASEYKEYNRRMRLLSRVLIWHLPKCRKEILEFIWNYPKVESKYWLVSNVLRELEVWGSPLAFQLFDNFLAKRPDTHLADYLQKAYNYDIEWVLKHLRNAIEEKLALDTLTFGRDFEFDLDVTEVIKHGIDVSPESIFTLLLEIQISILKPKKASNPSSSIVNDFSWILPNFDELHNHQNGLFSLLLITVRNLARKQSPSFTEFIANYRSSKSSTMLLLLVEGLRAAPEQYTSQAFEFLRYFFGKQGFNASSILAWRVRQLLKEVFSILHDELKIQIIQFLALNSDKFHSENELFFWLKCIHQSEFVIFPEVVSKWQMLEERFKNEEDYEPARLRWSSIGPPMSKTDYNEMSLSAWENSFYRYNYTETSSVERSEELEQHARRFFEEVTKRPDFFYPLLEVLTKNNNLTFDYLISGLEGLKEAKYDSGKIHTLFKKIKIANIQSPYLVRRLVNLCGYFIDTKLQDDYFLHLLIDLAKNHPDPNDESLRVEVRGDTNESIRASGINTVRGRTIYLLLHCSYFKQHENLIFDVLESVSITDLLMIRSQMMPRLALLISLNKLKTLRLFLRLTERNESIIMEQSMLCAQYLSQDYFEELMPYFKNMLAYPNTYKDIATILTLNWIYTQNNVQELFDQLLKESVEAKHGAILTAAHHILDNENNPIFRGIELFSSFLKDKDELIIRAYGLALQKLRLVDFDHVKSIFYDPSFDDIAIKNPRSFCNYLSKCANQYPEDCLSLIKNYSTYEKPYSQSLENYGREPLNVVLNAYHALWGKKKKDSAKIREALLLFDEMLQDDHLSNLAVGVLAKIVE